MLAGVIVTHTTWRWIYYSHAIVSAVFVVIIFVFFKETRGSVLLSRKAQTLNTYYEKLEEAGHYGVIMSSEDSSDEKRVRRIRWKVQSDEQRASLGKMIQISLYRPFREFPAKEYWLAESGSNKSLKYRYARHRACRIFLLPLGVLQLGDPLPPVQLRPARLPHEPQL
jgi:hypothetical protein